MKFRKENKHWSDVLNVKKFVEHLEKKMSISKSNAENFVYLRQGNDLVNRMFNVSPSLFFMISILLKTGTTLPHVILYNMEATVYLNITISLFLKVCIVVFINVFQF